MMWRQALRLDDRLHVVGGYDADVTGLLRDREHLFGGRQLALRLAVGNGIQHHQAADEAEFADHYDLVSLLIGVNNQYRGRDLAEYRGQFTDLLARAIEFAGGNARRVFVVSIPDWGVTPFAQGRDPAKIAREIDAFNAAAREIATKRGVAFVDITPISREPDAAVAGDGLHPGAAQYAKWAEAIEPVVVQLLTR